MVQKCPLLNYRIEDESKNSTSPNDITYNIESGFWECLNGEKYIEKITMNKVVDGTLITETGESTDRSEKSEFNQTTLITRTREGVDSSETSNYLNSTLITATRESIDRSETTA